MTLWVTQFWQDLVYGFRFMRRSLASSATAIKLHAIGIGINAAMFSVVNKVLLEPLPFPASERLVQLFVGSPMGRILVTSASQVHRLARAERCVSTRRGIQFGGAGYDLDRRLAGDGSGDP